MGEAFAYGFGTTIDSLELRKDAAKRLLDVMSEKRQKKMVAEWRKNMPDLDWDDAFTVILLTEGPEKLLADIINENCFDGKKVLFMQNRLFRKMRITGAGSRRKRR